MKIRIRADGHCIIYHFSNTFNIERNKRDNFFDPLTRTGGLVILSTFLFHNSYLTPRDVPNAPRPKMRSIRLLLSFSLCIPSQVGLIKVTLVEIRCEIRKIDVISTSNGIGQLSEELPHIKYFNFLSSLSSFHFISYETTLSLLHWSSDLYYYPF